MTGRSLRRSAGGVSLAVLASRILGLVREVVFASLFGAGRELDAFVAAFRIPNLFRDLFAEGALSAAFVSTFSRKIEREGPTRAWELAARVLNDLVIVVAVVVVLGIVFTPEIVGWIAPGFASEPGKAELTVFLTRLLFPFLLFVAVAAVAMGILNAHSVFGIPASASSFFNLGSIVGGLAGAWWLAPNYVETLFGAVAEPAEGDATRALTGMTFGTLLGGLLQFLVQVPSLHRIGFRWRPAISFSDPGVREVLRLMGPATVGIAAVQVNVFVNTVFASELGDGPVSWLNVAFRLMYLPIGMFGVALGTVLLPAVSRAASRDDLETFRARIAEGLGLLLALSLPAAVGLAVAAEPIVGLIYEHGRFGPDDTHAAAIALSAYSVGLVGYASVKILGPAFYALGDARTPATVSVISVGINLVLNWMAVRVLGLGHMGLALATSSVALWNAGWLLALLGRRLGALPREVFESAWRAGVASAGMGLACFVWMRWLDAGSGFAAHLTSVATTIPLGILSYGIVGRALRLRELQIGRLRRR